MFYQPPWATILRLQCCKWRAIARMTDVSPGNGVSLLGPNIPLKNLRIVIEQSPKRAAEE
jgi:hypothetical protein